MQKFWLIAADAAWLLAQVACVYVAAILLAAYADGAL